MTIGRQYQTPYERDVDADHGADVNAGALDADSRAEARDEELDQVQPDSVDQVPDSVEEGRDSFGETPDSFGEGRESVDETRGSLDETPDSFDKGRDSFDEAPDPVVDPGSEHGRLDDTVVVGEPVFDSEPALVGEPAFDSEPALAGEPGLDGRAVDVDPTVGTHALPREWQALQGRFVDDPDAAVSEAAALVEEAVRQLLDSLRDGASSDAGDVSTEDKRVAFQRYRAVYELVTQG